VRFSETLSLRFVQTLWLAFATQKAHSVLAIAKAVGGAAKVHESANPAKDDAWVVPTDIGAVVDRGRWSWRLRPGQLEKRSSERLPRP
jgi:hypothetical protein